MKYSVGEYYKNSDKIFICTKILPELHGHRIYGKFIEDGKEIYFSDLFDYSPHSITSKTTKLTSKEKIKLL